MFTLFIFATGQEIVFKEAGEGGSQQDLPISKFLGVTFILLIMKQFLTTEYPSYYCQAGDCNW